VVDSSVQAIIDQLVEAVVTNDQGRIDQLGRDLRDRETGIFGDWLDGGPFVTNNTVKEALTLYAETSSDLGEDRAAAIADGEPISLYEFRDFVGAGAAGMFENPEGPAWHISEVQSSTGTKAYVIGCVYASGLDGIDHRFLGIAKLESEARSMVERLFYINPQDLAARYPTKLQAIGDLFVESPKEDLSPLAQDRRRFAEKRGMDAFVRWKRNQYRKQEPKKHSDPPEE
jgi:hypothetical protein